MIWGCFPIFGFPAIFWARQFFRQAKTSGAIWFALSVYLSGSDPRGLRIGSQRILSGQGSFPTAYASRWDAAKRLVQTNANVPSPQLEL